MPETQYKIWDWGERTPDSGRNSQWFMSMRARAKRGNVNRYEVANEVLCTKLGQTLKLPIPVGCVVERQGIPYYASLEYSLAPESVPAPTDEEIAAIVAAHPRLVCGSIVFDCWIANQDRSNGNICYEEETGQFYLVDHGAALLCASEPKKAARELAEIEDELAVDANNNCFAAVITQLTDFDEWLQRILDVPEWFIRESAQQCSSCGYAAEEAELVTKFLISRRTKLRQLFKAGLAKAFPRYLPDLFDSFNSSAG